MSYQVLARKWRPSTFTEMVGQAHVLKALVNALDQQRLHHAYLFTGTRGVGKTTIARLLAKSLNCEVGVSSKPCGQCSACREIAEGRFVDLIEVDAASRTRVEDTRELLENVQYAPTRGRYKVYLIDEVHMLSVSSFNALLKTLEEPPPHVKFLLATTDPQKLPVTVLSRCLQFNLKNMTRESIVGYLNHILNEEQVPFEEPSLWLLAEAAQGSMRDALSLTDQAIAFGEGQLRETEVASMLGTVDLKRVLNLVRGLVEKDAPALMRQVADIAEHAPDYGSLLNELLSTLHRVAIAQAAPQALDNSKGDLAAIRALAQGSQAEDIHLFYQLGTAASKDMALAPSERAGFEMTLLRMLAFSPTPPKRLDDLPPLVSQSEPEVPAANPDASSRANATVAETTPPEPTPTEPVGTEPAPSIGDPEAEAPAEPQAQATAEAQPDPSPVNEAVAAQSVAATSEQPVESPPEPAAVPEPQAAATPEPQATSEMVAPESPEPEVGSESAEPQSEDDTPPFDVDPPVDSAQSRPEPVMTGTGEGDESTETDPAAESVAPEPTASSEPAAASSNAHPEPQPQALSEAPAASETTDESAKASRASQAQWPELDREADPKHWWQVTLHKLGLSGMTKTVFAHSEWRDYREGRLTLLISTNYRNVMNETQVQRLQEALVHELPGLTAIDTEFGTAEQTPQLWLDRLNHAAWEKAVAELKEDSFVRTLMTDFAAELQTDTVKPVHNPLPTGA
ncbi:DNA polymerase III subunit gamma/tau [Saccharospirillum salsuginis]|uniref:DNA polymerase III subunit gamma/tau n=1 Tax=Saccharospirillum salsuginis TaxID=418750 RepID=A0A918KER4_9GAMM|nr:DNA polymerase III subunit gamma/tau [Saccharospirillum salsuginis]GGX61066.1 DNA polymerase III subunit gamma/tau [Saccharospirillum salsuginis]